MRSLTPFLLLCLPLAAGDGDWLAETAKRFSSDRADVREAASQAIRARLQRELAPLLDAMRSKDPEVARRARETLASLLPDEPERAQQQQQAGQPGVVVIRGAQQQRIRIVMGNAGGGAQQVQWLVQAAPGNEANSAELRELGLDGHPLGDGLIRKQLRVARGRGFVLTKLVPARVAGKFGLRKDDILLSVDGKPVMQVDQVVKALGKMDRKDLEVVVLRDGKTTTLTRPKR